MRTLIKLEIFKFLILRQILCLNNNLIVTKVELMKIAQEILDWSRVNGFNIESQMCMFSARKIIPK